MRDFVYAREGELYHPSEWAGGPWSPALQHGGPVNALFARAAESAAAETGFRVARLTVDLFRPVPLRPLRCTWRFLRRGRRIANVEATLTQPDQAEPISRATALLLAVRPDLGRTWKPDAEPAMDPADAEPVEFMSRAYREAVPPGFHWSVQVRLGRDEGGAAVAWIRTPLELVEGEPTSPLQHCAAVCDLTFGVSARTALKRGEHDLSSTRITLINTDTTLYFEREPAGEWFAFHDAHVTDEAGIGLASVTLHDASGRLGSSSQALVANDVRRR